MNVILASIAAIALVAAKAGAATHNLRVSLDSSAAAVEEDSASTGFNAIIAGEPWSLEERMAHYNVNAVSLAVIKDYNIVWAEAFGLADVEEGIPATTSTLFQAASISKPVAASLVLAAAQNGELDLDAPINDILTSWKLPENEFTAQADVTPRRLLSHTAGTTVGGFGGYVNGTDIPTTIQILDGTEPANNSPVRVDIVPGSMFRYSGGGSTIMELAMTDLLGSIPYPELMKQRVLEPVGMTDSTFEQPLSPDKLLHAAAGYNIDGPPFATSSIDGPILGKRRTYPELAAAGMWTTATDLAKFAIDMQRALRGDEGTVLNEDMAKEMMTPVLEIMGLGFFQIEVDGKLYFSHSGSNAGFLSNLIASHDGDEGLALMANTGNVENFTQLALEIIAAADATFWSDDTEPGVRSPLKVAI